MAQVGGDGTGASHRVSGDLTDELIGSPIWTEPMLSRAGIPIIDRPIVTMGGGLGSFFLANLLRTAGAGTDQIAVCTRNRYPHETYRFLATNSQIPDDSRLRSDSQAMPDNLWGFPSFALREAGKGDWYRLWQVLTEPVIAEYFTPRSDGVFDGVVREADRIGWAEMIHHGQVRMIRRRHGGGYFTTLTPTIFEGRPRPPRRVAYRSRYVHVALGYPGARFLADLQEYRSRTGDHVRVVNAYEDHEHVYTQLRRRPCRVMVRGSGIVASRILQRLLDDREVGRSRTEVIHLFRTYVTDEAVPSGPKRRTYLGFAYQPFNLPKSAFGGQLADTLERTTDPEARRELLSVWARTTTAWRHPWVSQLERGLAGGYYHQRTGTVEKVDGDHPRLRCTIDAEGTSYDLDVDYIIDGTGLQAGVTHHRVLGDLVEVSGVGLNAMGRLDVDPHYELVGARQPPGRIFANGSMALGGYFAAVDSFYGLEHAAWRIADTMAADGVVPRIGTVRSVSQWLRRMRGVAP